MADKSELANLATQSIEDLIKLADLRLYYGKSAGRDMISKRSD